MKIFPILKKVITVVGGGGGANAIWDTAVEWGDILYSVLTGQPEQVNYTDDLGTTQLTDGENYQLGDVFTVDPTVNGAESANMDDGLLIQVGGLPMEGDSWTDQASTGTNHGSETTMIVKGKSSLANDERRAYLKLRIDKFVGFTSRSDKVTGLHLRCQNTGLSAVNVTAEFRTGAADPFTEGTINWTSQPSAYGTSRASIVSNIPTGAAALRDWFLSDAQEAAIFGSGDTWLLVILTAPSAAVPSSVTIDAREGTNQDPYMDVFLSIA